MKKLYLILLLSFPLISLSQNNTTSSGFRSGINIGTIPFGEIGLITEYYKGGNALSLNLSYNFGMQGDMATNYDFNKNTNGFLAAHGPVIRLGYKFGSNSDQSKLNFFLMPELLFKQAGYDHITFTRKSDDDYIELVQSMCGNRYGAGLRFGWQKYLSPESKIFWELNFSAGAAYRVDKFMNYSNKSTSYVPLNTLIKEEGWILNYSLGFIIGFDFSKK